MIYLFPILKNWIEKKWNNFPHQKKKTKKWNVVHTATAWVTTVYGSKKYCRISLEQKLAHNFVSLINHTQNSKVVWESVIFNFSIISEFHTLTEKMEMVIHRFFSFAVSLFHADIFFDLLPARPSPINSIPTNPPSCKFRRF